jgi:hypothetical protein
MNDMNYTFVLYVLSVGVECKKVFVELKLKEIYT